MSGDVQLGSGIATGGAELGWERGKSEGLRAAPGESPWPAASGASHPDLRGGRGVSAHLRGFGALVGFIREPFALLPGGDATGSPPCSQRAAAGGRPLGDLRGLHAGAPQRLRRVARLHLVIRDGAQQVRRLQGWGGRAGVRGCTQLGAVGWGGWVPPRYPALQRVAGLEVRRAGAVALLQLGDAVPIVQLLRFILTRPQVDAAAT